jgi:hypothetical protein
MSAKVSEKQKREPRFLPEFPLAVGESVCFITANGMESGVYTGDDRQGRALVKWAERVTVQRIERHLLRPCNDSASVARRGFIRQPGYNVLPSDDDPRLVETSEPVAERVIEKLDLTLDVEAPEPEREPATNGAVVLNESQRGYLRAISEGASKVPGRTLAKLRALGLVEPEGLALTAAGRKFV